MWPASGTRTCRIVVVAHHVAALGGDQQRRHGQLRGIRVEIVGVEAFVRRAHRAFVAGVQPFGAQLQLGIGPGRAERAHAFGVRAGTRERHRVDVPRQLARVVAAVRARDGRIDQHDGGEPADAAPGRARGDPRAHRMADEARARQIERGDERRDVVRLRIETVVERRRRVRQPAAAHVEHVGVERRAEGFADEAPRDRGARDAGNQHDRRARRARAGRAAVAQIVLADAVGADVRAVQESRGHEDAPK